MLPPVIIVSLFGDLLHAVSRLPGFPVPTYHDWMAAGGVVLTGMIGAGFTAVGLAEDLRSGFADRLRLLGITPLASTLGRLAFDAVRIAPAVLAVVAASWVLGDQVDIRVLTVAQLILLAAAWSGVYNALFHLVVRLSGSSQAPRALLPLFAPVTFLSTVWFPRQYMPGWASTAAGYNPVSVVTDAAHHLTTGHPSASAMFGAAAVIVVLGGALVSATIVADRAGRLLR
jgi:ABC-type polysaccharide/polyol phosphate export permease